MEYQQPENNSVMLNKDETGFEVWKESDHDSTQWKLETGKKSTF